MHGIFVYIFTTYSCCTTVSASTAVTHCALLRPQCVQVDHVIRTEKTIQKTTYLTLLPVNFYCQFSQNHYLRSIYRSFIVFIIVVIPFNIYIADTCAAGSWVDFL